VKGSISSPSSPETAATTPARSILVCCPECGLQFVSAITIPFDQELSAFLDHVLRVEESVRALKGAIEEAVL
jgi:hypothetical protein